jgi:hypothetical protein
MGKISVLGNNAQNGWIGSLSDAEFVQMPSFSLGEDGEMKLSEFIVKNIPLDTKACVLDVDSISNPEICLAFAVALRLSIFDLRATSLIPILFVSNATSDIYHGYKYSPIILTGSIAFEAPENVSDALEAMGAMSISRRKTFIGKSMGSRCPS